jgi:hypothetical protein
LVMIRTEGELPLFRCHCMARQHFCRLSRSGNRNRYFSAKETGSLMDQWTYLICGSMAKMNGSHLHHRPRIHWANVLNSHSCRASIRGSRRYPIHRMREMKI